MDPIIVHHAIHYFASGCTGTTIGCNAPTGGTSQFWSTSLGGFVGSALAFIGWIVVIVAIIKGGFDAFGGKLGKTFKVLILALAFGALMIYPALIGDFISFFEKIVSDLITSGAQLTKKGGTSTTTVAGALTNGLFHSLRHVFH